MGSYNYDCLKELLADKKNKKKSLARLQSINLRSVELVEKRGITSKTFFVDGHYSFVGHCKPIHYPDADNKLRTIDLTLNLTNADAGKDYSEQYLMDKNLFTVGFRNDKKLSKMYGIRRGDDTQFESTYKEIWFDFDGKGLVQIELPEKFKEIKKISDYELEHIITDEVSIYTRLHETHIISAVHVKKKVYDFKIVEELSTKGLTKGTDADKQFEFGSKDYPIKLRPPRMWIPETSEKERLSPEVEESSGEVTHAIELDKKDIYTYIKVPTKKGKDWLSQFDETYIDAQPQIHYAESDGFVRVGDSATWVGARDGAGKLLYTGAYSTSAIRAWYSSSTQYYSVSRAFFSFDVSSLPDSGITIYAAALIISSPTFAYGANVVVQEGTQGDTLTTGDFQAFTGDYYCYVDDYASGKNTFLLDDAGISNIPTDDSVYYCIREYDHDVQNVSPKGVGGARGYYSVGAYFSAQTGTDSDPKIVIFYYIEGTNTLTYTEDGLFCAPEGVTEVEVLVVGGGGQSGEGDTTTDENGGGGGAGGLILMDGENKYQLSESEIANGVAITIGAGGAGNTADTSPGTSGGDSTFGRLTAKGGGGGGGQGAPRNGAAGGSGGGGGCDGTAYGTGGSSTQSAQEGDSGTYGFGNAGGSPDSSGVACGGGGAGGAPVGATGGVGKTVWGTTYAKGGTAQGNSGNAAANTGDGADSRANDSGSDGYSGGSGIVIVRFEISSAQQLVDTVEFTANFAPSVTKVLSLVKSAAIGLATSAAFTKVLTLVPDVAITSNFTLVEGTLYTPVSISTSSTYDVSKSTMFGLNVPFTETVSATVSQVQTLYASLDCTVEATISSVTIGILLFDTCNIGITGSVGTPTATQSLVSTLPIDVNASVGVTPIQTLYQSIDLASIYNIDSVTYGTWILDSIDIGTTVGISATQVTSYLPTVEFTQTDSISVAGVSSLYSSIDILPTYSATASVGFSETVNFTATKSININTYQEIEVNISPTYSVLAAMGRIYMETVLFTTNVYTSVTPVTTGLTLLSWNIIVTREGQTLNLADLNIVTHADFTDVMGNRSGSFEIHILNPNGTNDDVVRIGDDVYLYVDEESPATRKVFHGKITTIDYTRNSFGAYDLVAKGEDYGTLRFKQTVVTGVNDYIGWDVADIIEDVLTKFCPDITTTNVESADFPTPIDQIRISWEYVGEAIEKLASIVGASFYVDEDDDLHFYDPSELVSQHNIKDRNIINAKIRRDASKAFDKIMVIGGKQKTLDQSETTVTHQSSAINDRQLAFSFTPAVTNLFSIDMHIDKIGIVSEDIQFSIVEDNSGAPTGSTVAYGSFSSATITDTPAWISSSYFDAVVDITKDYWVVISKCGANSSNTYKFSCDDTATSHKYDSGAGWSDATGILAYKTYYGIQVIKISNADTKIMGSYYSELPIFDNSIKDANTAALLASKKLIEYSFQTAADYVVNTVGTRYVPGEIATITSTIPNAGEQTFLSVKYEIDATRITNIVLTCTKADDLYSTFAKMFADLRKVKAEQLLAGQSSGIDYIEETEDSFTPDEDITLVDNIDADPEYDKETTLWGLFSWA